ncbi:hypothetical protein ECG_07618 [Echinococcus granulosus]|nr:hypothetical protein ECG_07618 [Echinococcus granulosus]
MSDDSILNRTFDIDKSNIDVEKEETSGNSGSPHTSEGQVSVSTSIVGHVGKPSNVGRALAPTLPVSPSLSKNTARVRPKAPWTDRPVARKRFEGNALFGQGLKRTFPPPFPVTSSLSRELRLMVRGSDLETEKEEVMTPSSSVNNSATTSAYFISTPWREYLRREGLRGCLNLQAERLKQRRNLQQKQASCSGRSSL